MLNFCRTCNNGQGLVVWTQSYFPYSTVFYSAGQDDHGVRDWIELCVGVTVLISRSWTICFVDWSLSATTVFSYITLGTYMSNSAVLSVSGCSAIS